MDEAKIERIAARMRKVGERHELLAINERLRIAIRPRRQPMLAWPDP